jgi:hypothetical protein
MTGSAKQFSGADGGHDFKVKSGRRGDLHIIGELYVWNGKPNEGTNSPIADITRIFNE